MNRDERLISLQTQLNLARAMGDAEECQRIRDDIQDRKEELLDASRAA